MNYIDPVYDPIGVVKSQLCSAIINSEEVRNALDYKGEGYDPEDPFSLMYSCVLPYLQHPDVITTTEPLIFVGIDAVGHRTNMCISNLTATVVCSVDKDDMRTQKGFYRNDLLDNGCINYTKPDLIGSEVIKAVASLKGTWIGDIQLVSSVEKPMSLTRYCRTIGFSLIDINVGGLLQNG